MEIINLLAIWDSKHLQSMKTKRHQTDNVNMSKIARKKKKEIWALSSFCKIFKADTNKNGH